MSRAGITLVVTLSIFGAGISAQAAEATPASIKASIPSPTGKRAVGTRAIELVDRSRRMGFGLKGPRRLMVQLTYPIVAKPRCRAAPYAPKGILERLQEGLSLAEPLRIDSGICAGGKIRGGSHPLVIFSHLYAGDGFIYAALIDDLASRGFIVASIDHTGEAFAVRFPHSGYVEGIYGGVASARALSAEENQALVDVRAADVSFVLSKLRERGRRRRGILAGHVGARAGIFGHSLGGATASQTAVVDHRFDAAANLDGEIWGGAAKTTGAKIPFLLAMAGNAPLTFRFLNVCDFYSASTGRHYAWLLSGALHNSFNDLQVLAPQIAEQDPNWPLAGSYQSIVGTIDPVASITSQRKALGTFFSAYLQRRRKSHALSPPGSFTEAPANGLTCV